MFLSAPPSGNPRWRLRYHFLVKEKLISLGAFPAVSLKEARTARDAAKAELLQGLDPSVLVNRIGIPVGQHQPEQLSTSVSGV